MITYPGTEYMCELCYETRIALYQGQTVCRMCAAVVLNAETGTDQECERKDDENV